MPIKMTRSFLSTIIFIVLITMSPATAVAWGPEGHLQVGLLALQGLDQAAASRVEELLELADAETVSRACNWPDVVRETPAWEWSAPQHYVNIPRSSAHYDRQRDCPDGLCVTEAIKKYAAQLVDPHLDKRKQWEAFAWLCHLVGDLHQPLHAGYRDDRGGNDVNVSFQGETINLHKFWDSTLIRENLGSDGGWHKPASAAGSEFSGGWWNPAQTHNWTDESHWLVKEAAYPPGEIIQEDFAISSWLLIREQWLKAGDRLALILNATVGEGEVTLVQGRNGSE
jgi:hypothetical protein